MHKNLESKLQKFPSERRLDLQTTYEYEIWKSETKIIIDEFREWERMVDLRYELTPLAQDFYDFCRDHNLKWEFYESMLDKEKMDKIEMPYWEWDDLPF